jgi:phosphopantetheinyl transferase
MSVNKVTGVGPVTDMAELQVSANKTLRKINSCHCPVTVRASQVVPFNFCANPRVTIYFHVFDRQEHAMTC